MANYRQLNFLKDITKVKLEPEKFIEQVRLFSQYLVHSNQDYNYNETYLENFCLEFINFKKDVEIKNQIFGEIIKSIIGCPSNLDLQFSVDQFWFYSSSNSEMSVGENINVNKICGDKTLIKGTLTYENKRYLFMKEYLVITQEKLLDKVVNQICTEILQWLERISNEKE